jgi:hypothetical protein
MGRLLYRYFYTDHKTPEKRQENELLLVLNPTANRTPEIRG